MAAKIFINYRRDDSLATAGRLHDRLVREFGRKNVFMDIDNIPIGKDFVEQLTKHVTDCDAFLALIGPRWLNSADEKGCRKLDNIDDFVVIEISAALARGIPVIPVLLEDAELPNANDLPDALKPLVRRQAAEIRNTQFGRDSQGLIERLRGVLIRKRRKRPLLRVLSAAVVVFVLIIALGRLSQTDVAIWMAKISMVDKEQLPTIISSVDNRNRLLDLLAANPSVWELVEDRLETLGYIAILSRRDDKPFTYWLKPGASESFKDCAFCPEMVVVPSGEFTMGSPENETERETFSIGNQSGTESPQVSVTIGNPFAVSKFSVTRGEFTNFVRETRYKMEGDCFNPATGAGVQNSWLSPGYRQDDRDPVVCVGWQDAKAFVSWLSAKVGIPFRLLSESEREYVTRAGATSPFWWGSSITTAQANYNGGAYAGGSQGENRGRTVHVDTFAPNWWGLYNVHGNVWEWTEDCWNQSHAGNPANGSARTDGECGLRIVRGGSWWNNGAVLRAAYRWAAPISEAKIKAPIGLRDASGGFRVARDLKR